MKILREKYLELLALLGVLRIKLPLEQKLIEIYTLADGYDAVEETLFHNVYFKPHEIRDADTIIDLGAYIGGFTIYATLYAKSGAKIITVEPNPYA